MDRLLLALTEGIGLGEWGLGPVKNSCRFNNVYRDHEQPRTMLLRAQVALQGGLQQGYCKVTICRDALPATLPPEGSSNNLICIVFGFVLPCKIVGTACFKELASMLTDNDRA